MGWLRQLRSDIHQRAFWVGVGSAFDISGRWTRREMDKLYAAERARVATEVRARFGPVLAAMAEQRDDPGAVDDLAAEMAEWAWPRKRATSEML